MIRGDWSEIIHFIWMNKLEKSWLVFTICIYYFQDSETSFNYSGMYKWCSCNCIAI